MADMIPKENVSKGNECVLTSWQILFKGQMFTQKVKRERIFFNFSGYFLLYFKYFCRVWASQIHINFENLKKLLLKRTQNYKFS